MLLTLWAVVICFFLRWYIPNNSAENELPICLQHHRPMCLESAGGPMHTYWIHHWLVSSPSLSTLCLMPAASTSVPENLPVIGRRSISLLRSCKNPPIPLLCDQPAHVWGRCWCQGITPLELRVEPKVQGIMTWHCCQHRPLG